ncbi:magnesium transporter CorA family protein [Pseudarthrobacter sp. fls2-241-R2A-127]|uniref:magnesium transporter CorA family protein n=1 Tax=Pseudarthrobacter sp. fls2-241-R2A-127 TaxID=3040303 RepID=UPI002556E095|nr:magnesium transporter CorA family protein [Pseudarthrobacter sp. fls2-241-R2A-127]
MMCTRLYRHGRLEREDLRLEELDNILSEEGVTVWIDYMSPTADDLAGIEKALGLHRLAVEDAVHEHQRPKLDRYPGHLFLAAYHAELAGESNELKIAEVKAFITKRALVTVHGPEMDPGQLTAHWDAEPDLAVHGTSFLLWGLLDLIVDGHFDTVQELDSRIDSLEDVLFVDHAPDHDLQRRSFELRKSLVRLRRAVLPMREVLNTLLRRDLEVLDPEMQPFLQDVYDHVLRVSEWTESLRDLVTTILETHISIQGNRMNLVMKKVTSWAAIIAVPTAVTGFFGQNVPFLGFQSPLGLTLSLTLIIVASAGLYLSFKKKEWI